MRKLLLILRRGIKAMALWFCVTGITALVAARRRDFSAHKVWVIRHVASGIWVSIMRAMIPLLHFALRTGSLLLWGRAVDTSEPAFLKAIWNDSGLWSMLIGLAGGEIALWAIRAEERAAERKVA